MIKAGHFDEEPYTVREKLMYERFMAEFDKKVVMDSDYRLREIGKEQELKKTEKDDDFKRVEE